MLLFTNVVACMLNVDVVKLCAQNVPESPESVLSIAVVSQLDNFYIRENIQFSLNRPTEPIAKGIFELFAN